MVVLGSLNPAILTPNWLGKRGLLAKGEKVEAKLNLGSYFPGEFKAGKYNWTIDHSKLQVNVPAEKQYTNYLSDFVIKVFKELNHTPITANGENFTFASDGNIPKLKFLDRDDLGFGKRTNWGTITSLNHHVRVSIDEISNINITITNDGKGYQIKFNFHCDANTIPKLVSFSEEIETNLNKAEKILEEILKK